LAIGELVRPLPPGASPWPALGAALLAGVLDPSFTPLLPIAGIRLLTGPWTLPRWTVAIPVFGALVLALAVASVGITIGAEYDVVFYLVSRHFGLRSFASMMGALLTAGALGAAIAAVVAGVLHERFGGYDPMLVPLVVLLVINISERSHPKKPAAIVLVFSARSSAPDFP